MDPEKGNRADLKIDFREQRSGIVSELEKLANRPTFELCTLPTGDYLIGDKIIVERKTLNDFLGSIKDGRIFRQAYRIVQSGKNGLIILEGDKSTVGPSCMTRKAVQGALVHLTVFIGIPVIRSLDIHETATLLVDLFHQCQRQELPRQKQAISGKPGIRIDKKQRQKLFLLQNLPGIGTKRGLALLRLFSTFENIINAPPDELAKAEGIGRKLANNIFAILHEPF